MRKTAILTILLLSVLPVLAQNNRKITPVETDDKKPPQPTLHFYDKHGEALKEPVLFLADLDTVSQVKSGPVYPLYNGCSVGVNFMDMILRAAGQRFASIDISADVSLHNWFFPVVEAGVGFGKSEPKEGAPQNYIYTARPSFYIKAGINYNFLYKSNPDYQAYLGLRGAFSSFGYDITDVSFTQGYWDETAHFDIGRQRASCFYGEVLAGLKVKIWSRLSMGWTVRYHMKIHETDGSNSSPWFVPGYGSSNSLLFTYSLIWNI